MRRRKNCGFPNSIEVLWRGGKREFFTSFLSREDAFRLIMVAWHQNRRAVPRAAAAPAPGFMLWALHAKALCSHLRSISGLYLGVAGHVSSNVRMLTGRNVL